MLAVFAGCLLAVFVSCRLTVFVGHFLAVIVDWSCHCFCQLSSRLLAVCRPSSRCLSAVFSLFVGRLLAVFIDHLLAVFVGSLSVLLAGFFFCVLVGFSSQFHSHRFFVAALVFLSAVLNFF